jgi:hypothetical protein
MSCELIRSGLGKISGVRLAYSTEFIPLPCNPFQPHFEFDQLHETQAATSIAIGPYSRGS